MAVCTKTHEDKTSSRPRRNAVERPFSTTGCALDVEDFRKTRPARRTQAVAPEAVGGHSKKFNPLLPACKRTAHPDQEQPIQSRQEQSRKVMAAGAPGQEDVNQPERFSGLQRTVGAWQLSGPGLHAQARPGRSAGLLAGSVGGYGRLGEQARSARSSCIQRDPGPCYTGMQGDAAAGKYGCPQAVCKWPVGNRQARGLKKSAVINDLRMQRNAVATGRCLFFACFPQGPAQRAGRRCKAKGGRPLSSCWP